MDLRGFLIIAVLNFWLRGTKGIIGYDCGSASTNITTLSLLGIEECDIPQPEVAAQKIYIQLLQINEFTSARVIQCKIEIDRLIRRCGMFSHSMDVYNGKHAYIEEVSRDACQRMHMYGTYEIGNTRITGLKSNQTATRPVTLAGHVNNDGTCSGTTYSDPFGTWEKAVVLATIKITLQDYIADVKINTNRVQLRSGVTCALSATHCTDIEGGDTYWASMPTDTCRFGTYGVLYEGYAHRIIDVVNKQQQIVYSMTTEDTVFALASRDSYSTCGYTLFHTEHPKLVIFETSPGVAIFKKESRIANLDIFTYMNSKFVYVEKHVRTQFSELYKNILLQQCQLEQKILHNSLAIATQSPDVFAYHFMKGPGYMALLAGEVIHIVKCVPVEVRVAHTEECYDQLPVTRENRTQFLTPQTHILLRQGTQITCNLFAPPMYLLGDAWYRLTPKPIHTVPPMTMKPMTTPSWKYISPGSLATSGIYTEGDLSDLRDHIMFPAERPAMLNTLARGMMGHSTIMHDGGSFANFLDEASVEKIAMSAWQKFWDRFLIFGNISAGFLGIYLAVRAVKLILDTIVHGYALHTVYGWSIYLLGAIWDSLTQLLLHLKLKKPRDGNRETMQPSAERNPIEDSSQRGTYPLLPAKDASTYTFALKD
ncbi:uncharacterized protein [Linepithema humile]|uniref:uncharacterized protein n=2 Tax=Linepithema humile TaxID=83485 RepID=UPI00351EECFD